MTLTTLAAGYFRFWPLFTTEPLLTALLVNIDFLIFLTNALVGICDVLIAASGIVFVSVISQQDFKNQQKVLKTLKNSRKKVRENLCFSITAHFRVQHTKTVCFLATFNEALSSPFFASYLLGNIGYNSYSFVFIAYNTSNLSPLIRTGYTLWQLMHGSTPVGVSTFVVAINRRMYSGEKVIAGILASSKKNHPKKKFYREQWKLPCYLELLDDGGAKSRRRTRTMALSAGLFGVIERRTLLEFALIYVAFLLHFGGLMNGKANC